MRGKYNRNVLMIGEQDEENCLVEVNETLLRVLFDNLFRISAETSRYSTKL